MFGNKARAARKAAPEGGESKASWGVVRLREIGDEPTNRSRTGIRKRSEGGWWVTYEGRKIGYVTRSGQVHTTKSKDRTSHNWGWSAYDASGSLIGEHPNRNEAEYAVRIGAGL